MNKARDAWRAATRYEELCSLAAAFLTGGIDHFPGWGAGDTDEETDEVEGLLTSCCLGGFLTVASQRGQPERPGADGRPERRRAFVTGFMDPGAAAALSGVREAGLRLVHDLEEDLPLGLRGEDVFLALGPGAREAELELFAHDLGPQGLSALQGARWACVLDPTWGRDDRLWPTLAAALGTPYP